MTLELLVHIGRLPPQGAGLRAALAMASRLGARLDAMHVVDLPAAAFTVPEAVPMQLDAVRQRSTDARAVAGDWAELLASRGLRGNWRVGNGDTVTLLAHASAGYDLVVMERSSTMRGDAPVGFGVVSRTVFASSRGVLVVPEAATVDTLGEHVLVAWSGSRESALAVRSSLPMLRKASRVTVIDGSVDEDIGTCALPDTNICGWLDTHGVKAEVRRLDEASRASPGPALLDIAHAENADLIVMGAWGRSRLSEMVLGGTTRFLFMQSDVPMLVAH
ncbi:MULTISPECIES: universal stress protein [unclassified Luteibacter]|uniref:universal stress protein n=1 Tax=unclassified Luteibacter TaxID=2620188 RepID=UPI0008D8013A|nr:MULTISPECIES: universal stress protein [unclassified Luteibacter]MDR6936942.1 nucleotide-binding universal stress UspA family protein [Luteibacter sp. 3190]SEP07013.1 Universal stress protein family protein [Luteibacter sp. UNC138MFCol5.1]SEW15795.1 Universal stress protein family protein [Luteibacter sp. 329MFSha]